MSQPRRVQSLFVGLAMMLAPAVLADPLDRHDLVQLHGAGLTEEALKQLTLREGLAEAFDADDVLSLMDAGLPATFVSWLITGAPMADAGVSTAMDGDVVVVSGSGEANESADTRDEEPASEEATSSSSSASSTAPTVIVVGGAPGYGAPAYGPAYGPAWGSWGWPGVAEIPARFGARDSAFGRTVVSLPVAGGGCGPIAPIAAPIGTGHVNGGVVRFHTSRGAIYHSN